MQWDKLIPVLASNFDPSQSAHAIPPEDIPIIIMLDGSSSVATLARLTDQKPDELYARLKALDEMGFLTWSETKKTVKKYNSFSIPSGTLREAAQKSKQTPPPSQGGSPKNVHSPSQPSSPSIPVKPPSDASPSRPSAPALSNAESSQPGMESPPPPPRPAHRSPSSADAPSADAHPSAPRKPSPRSKFRPFKARGSETALQRKATNPATDGPPKESKFKQRLRERQQTEASNKQEKPMPPSEPTLQQAPPSPSAPSQAATSEPTLQQAPPKPSAPSQAAPPKPSAPSQAVPAPRRAKGLAPMPMTSWELERAKQQGSEVALNSASVDGIMDLTGFEETGIAPSPAMSEPKSFQKFNGFDEEGTGDSGNAKKEQTALETAMKERGPGKQGDAQEKASEVKVESEHALEEEEAWDSVDDWWALSPEDVGLHSEDYAELIQKRKERQMAAEGNREEEDDSHDFNPMWRKELFGVG